MRDVEKVASNRQSVVMDKSKGVEVLFSDSALVKAKLITPELDHYKTQDPYYEMKKGVTVIFYDQNQKESSRIVADYAIQHEKSKIVEMRRNVIATSVKGDVFKSDELFWDPSRTKPIYSNALVSITQKNGNVLYGTGIESDEGFKNAEIKNATGTFPSGAKIMQ